jgi:hypothetical protein
MVFIKDKKSSLFCLIGDKEKKFYKIKTWASVNAIKLFPSMDAKFTLNL